MKYRRHLFYVSIIVLIGGFVLTVDGLPNQQTVCCHGRFGAAGWMSKCTTQDDCYSSKGTVNALPPVCGRGQCGSCGYTWNTSECDSYECLADKDCGIGSYCWMNDHGCHNFSEDFTLTASEINGVLIFTWTSRGDYAKYGLVRDGAGVSAYVTNAVCENNSCILNHTPPNGNYSFRIRTWDNNDKNREESKNLQVASTGVHCGDGVRNGDEFGVDCGGRCRTCLPSEVTTYMFGRFGSAGWMSKCMLRDDFWDGGGYRGQESYGPPMCEGTQKCGYDQILCNLNHTCNKDRDCEAGKYCWHTDGICHDYSELFTLNISNVNESLNITWQDRGIYDYTVDIYRNNTRIKRFIGGCNKINCTFLDTPPTPSQWTYLVAIWDASGNKREQSKETQKQSYATHCFNQIKDENETGVDCGGSCPHCNLDLMLNSSDISFTPEKPVEGDVVTVTAVVRNMGYVNASDVVVRFLDNTSVIGSTQVSVGGGSTTATSVNWTPVVGVHTITVVVDPEDNISESDESNNNASKNITVKPKPNTPTSDRAFILAPYYWQGYVEHSEDLVRELDDIGYDNPLYLKNDGENTQIDIPRLYDILNSEFGILHITSHGDVDCIAIESFENSSDRLNRARNLTQVYSGICKGMDTTSKKPYLGVNGDFIRNLTVNKFSNPLVYFEACEMGVNTNMVNAFLDKSVGAYVGFDKEVAICTGYGSLEVAWLCRIRNREAGQVTSEFYNHLYDGNTVNYAVGDTPPADPNDNVNLVSYGNPDLKILRQSSSKKTGTLYIDETVSHDVLIDPSVTQATFKITWPGSDLDLVLYAPNGTLIEPSVAMDSPDIDYVEGGTYEYYTVRDPESGNWSMEITAVDAPPDGEEYTAKADMIANIILRVSTDQRRYDPNDVITVTAFLQDDDTPLTGAAVTAEIEKPDETVNISLFDDGSHGDIQADDGVYANTYTDTSSEGVYQIRVTASGTTPEGFLREAMRTVEVWYIPDVAINVEDVSLSNDTPLEGEAVTVNATIHNIGGTNASTVIIQFYALDVSGNATQIGLNQTIDYLGVGGNETVHMDWEPSAGNYSIYVLADPYDSIKEEDESNNYASVNISVLPDSDRDGITDSFDNCPFTPNPDQLDTDLDSMGDACDPDDDNDGVLDAVDNCPLDANPEQSDFDGDKLGDVCDPDDDNDSDPDETDCEPYDPQIHHNATEVCNNIDDNCDGLVDEVICGDPTDADCDTVNDCTVDKCLDTTPRYATSELKPNHYDSSNLDLTQTHGCSCIQILDCKPGNNNGEVKHGCTEGTMKKWLSQQGWAETCSDAGESEEEKDKGKKK